MLLEVGGCKSSKNLGYSALEVINFGEGKILFVTVKFLRFGVHFFSFLSFLSCCFLLQWSCTLYNSVPVMVHFHRRSYISGPFRPIHSQYFFSSPHFCNNFLFSFVLPFPTLSYLSLSPSPYRVFYAFHSSYSWFNLSSRPSGPQPPCNSPLILQLAIRPSVLQSFSSMLAVSLLSISFHATGSSRPSFSSPVVIISIRPVVSTSPHPYRPSIRFSYSLPADPTIGLFYWQPIPLYREEGNLQPHR